MRLLVIVLIGVSTGFVIGRYAFRDSRDGATNTPANAPGALGSDIVVALGRIEPASGVHRIGGPASDVLEKLLVQEGDWLEAGAPIGYLSGRDESEALAAKAKAKLQQAKDKFAADLTHSGKQIDQADIKVRRDKTIPLQHIQVQEAKICQIESQLSFAEWNVERLRRLSRNDSVSEKDFKKEVSDLDAKRAELAGEKATLAKLKDTQTLDVAQSEAELAVAKAAMELISQSSEVPSLASDAKAEEARARQKTIRAPIAGKVLRILTRSGQAVGSDPILHFGDTRQMDAVAEVYETDIGKVRVGQKALVSSPVWPKPLSGTVDRIGQSIYKQGVVDDDPASPKNARVVEAHVRLADGKSAEAYTNLQVRVTIDVKSTAGPKPGGR